MSKLLFIFLFSIFSDLAIAQYQLTIEIEEIRNDKGRIMLQILDAKENIVTREMASIKVNKCSFRINDLKRGNYAVRYYHDENMNGKMETNSFGKPTEGYGFSNNVKGRFGPPEFTKTLFEISSDKKIVLKTVY